MDTLSGGDISNIRFSVLKSLGFRSIYLYFAETSIIDVAQLLRRVRSLRSHRGVSRSAAGVGPTEKTSTSES